MSEAANGHLEKVAKVYSKTCCTARQIGNALGVSRNAVIGWYSRNPNLKKQYPLDGQRPGGGGRKKGQKNRPKPDPSMAVDIIARQTRLKQRELVEAPPIMTEEVGRYTLTELPPNGCKWPSGESPTFFCGEPRGEDTAYCPDHRKRAHVSPEIRRTWRRVRQNNVTQGY